MSSFLTCWKLNNLFQDCQVSHWKSTHKGPCGKATKAPPNRSSASTPTKVTPSSASNSNSTSLTQSDVLPLLPLYNLAEKSKDAYLTLFSRKSLPQGIPVYMGAKLLEWGTLQVPINVSSHDEKQYICDVTVFDEMKTGIDFAVSAVHRKAIRLLCGEDGVDLLESHKKIGKLTWLLTGGAINVETHDPPPLHLVTKLL